MAYKNPYSLFFGPADEHGRVSVGRRDVERQITAELKTGMMDYAPLTEWSGELIVSAFDRGDVDRARSGYETWGRYVPDAYPPAFPRLMTELGERLSARAGEPLTVAVEIEPDGVFEVKVAQTSA